MTLGDWVGIAGLAVSVVGFSLAIWQLARTAKASEATREAIERTEKRMALNHLLVLLPQFHLLENDLDRAAEDNDRALARRALVSYSHFASEVAAILRGQDQVDQTLITELQSSARDASLAKATLIDAPINKNTKQLTRDVRARISALSVHVATIAANYQITTT